MTDGEAFQKRVCEIASFVFDRPFGPRKVAGVNFDCVAEIAKDRVVVIEATIRTDLDKVRTDVNRLSIARTAFFQENIYAECYLVMQASPSVDFQKTGDALKVKVCSSDELLRQLFDYKRYLTARARQTFGSTIDPESGESDNAQYIPVEYKAENNRDLSLAQIGEMLAQGKK